jgi:adenosyl cobinamide kinase/adenosyl cobinamide phosphate guanylyltransferase
LVDDYAKWYKTGEDSVASGVELPPTNSAELAWRDLSRAEAQATYKAIVTLGMLKDDEIIEFVSRSTSAEMIQFKTQLARCAYSTQEIAECIAFDRSQTEGLEKRMAEYARSQVKAGRSVAMLSDAFEPASRRGANSFASIEEAAKAIPELGEADREFNDAVARTAREIANTSDDINMLASYLVRQCKPQLERLLALIEKHNVFSDGVRRTVIKSMQDNFEDFARDMIISTRASQTKKK